MRRAVTQFIAHYYLERPHQGKGNELLLPSPISPLWQHAGACNVKNEWTAEVLSKRRMNMLNYTGMRRSKVIPITEGKRKLNTAIHVCVPVRGAIRMRPVRPVLQRSASCSGHLSRRRNATTRNRANITSSSFPAARPIPRTTKFNHSSRERKENF